MSKGQDFASQPKSWKFENKNQSWPFLKTGFGIFSTYFENRGYFSKYVEKIPPPQGAAAPWGAAEGGARGIFSNDFEIIPIFSFCFENMPKPVFENGQLAVFQNFKIQGGTPNPTSWGQLFQGSSEGLHQAISFLDIHLLHLWALPTSPTPGE